MLKNKFRFLMVTFLLMLLVACSSPEEKAEKYYQKGMALLDKQPAKAKLEFQNALQIKKNMGKAMYGLGLVAEREGDWKGAFSFMRQVAEQDPKNIDALVKLGQIFLAAGKLDFALEKSTKALELDKNNVAALNLYAAIQLKQNNKKGALEYAKLALAQDKTSQDAFLILANVSLAENDSAQALTYFDKALAVNEKNMTVLFLKAKALEGLSKPEEADKTYKKMVEFFPDNTFIKKTYAQFLMKTNRAGEAEQQLHAIATKSPDNLLAKLDVVNFLLATKGGAAGRTEMESFVKKEPKNYDLAFALGDLYRAQKDSVAEEKLLNQIIKDASGTAPGYKAQGLIAYKLMANGKNAEASKMLNDIITADTSNSLALTLRANLAMQEKNYDAAISDLRSVLRDSPDSSNAALMLATTYESVGSAQLAEESYIKAFDTSKQSAKYGVPYAQFLVRRKQPERAEKLLESMLSSHPSDAQALRALAQFKISKGDYAGAQALADRVKNSDAQSPITDEILGAISSNKNDLVGTISALKRAHDKFPNDIKIINSIVNAYVQAGKTQDAIGFMQTVLKTNPNNTDVKLMMGQLYASAGMSQNAIQTFTNLIQTNPDVIVAYQRLALEQVNTKLAVEAEKTIEQGLKIAPHNFGLLITQASTYEASGKYDNAISVYEKLIVDRPDSEIVVNNLAFLLLDARTDKASFERAYQLVGKTKANQQPQFLDTVGWANYKVGKFDEAEVALTKAIEQMPEMAVFYYHLAKVQMAKNDNVAAKQTLQKVIKYASNAQSKQDMALKDDANKLLQSLPAAS
ncbi:MAG: tetratricopeptide repeat protein [Bdellovibrio sp.]|nr:tetratricopeptide repeat protein [Methylotenera sp.]